MMKAFKLRRLSLAIASALGLAGSAHGQVVINDTLTGGHSLYNWQALNGACLTAGDNSNTPSDGTQYTPSTASLTIPACSGLSYYTGKSSTLVGGVTGALPDASGLGALRLTNGDTTTGTNGNNQTGAVVSGFTFPSNQGLQVTWTSVTYGGNAYKNNHASTNSDGSTYNNLSGADGISFFLSDGGKPATPTTPDQTIPPSVGALGGSLGYSCSNGNGTYDGVIGGYLGIGMDEYGNFSNSGDNTSSGASSGQTPGAIAVRGAGHTAWSWLKTNYPAYYANGGDPASAVHATCKTGKLYNYTGSTIKVPVTANTYTADYSYTKSGTTTTGSITSSSTIPSSSKCDNSGNPSSSGNFCTYTNITANSQTVANGSAIPSNVVGGVYQLDYNYPYLTGSTFPQGTYIFNQEAAGSSGGKSNAVRGKATSVTYALTITQAGLLTLTYAIAGAGGSPGAPFTVLNNFDIQKSNGPLPANFRFGFSAGTGGGSNVHEITCFKAAPSNTSGSTAGSNVLSGQVQSDSQVYLAYYHPINSWGSLTAQNLVFTPPSGSTPGTLVVSPAVNWDAGCVLTGGACQSSGTTVTAPLTNTTRTILSWDGTKGIPFEWGNITSTQKTSLTSGDSSQTSDRLDYLRGSRSNEVANSGPFRTRTSLLGDIVDSSPVWVGPPNLSYGNGFTDQLYPTTTMPEGTSYAAYKTGTAATRTNVVYAGANDGMLHGFRAGSYSNGSLVQTTNDGQEVLSYVPAQVVSTIHSTTSALDYASPSYAHNFFVDGSPAQGDLYYNGTWHTWIVGGLGPGGQATVNGPVATTTNSSGVTTPDTTTVATGTVFALDVTDPSTFAETAANSLVKGEWSSVSLNSGGAYASLCTGAGSNCGDHLGATYGTPVIRRLHDGTWGVIFGNGLNSKAGTAGIFIVHVSATDGSTKGVQFLDTGSGSTSSLNGIVQVTPADLDGDHVTDYVYAGDVQGHVWRFDLTSATATSWAASASPLFTTKTGQPITSGIAVASVTAAADSAGLTQRILLAFGTGEKLPKTLTSDSWYPTTQQSIYGIWDANMTAWNLKSSVQYAALASQPTITAGSSTSLLQHTLTTNSSTGARTTDVAATVCWFGTSACTGTGATNLQYGWEVDLSVTAATTTAPAVAEQVLFNPLVVGDFFNTNTDIPTVAQALTCSTSSQSAYSIGLLLATGGASSGTSTSSGTTESYFSGYAVGTVGVATQATGTSSAVSASDNSQWLVFQKNDGTGGTLGIDPNAKPGTATGGERLTWTKLR